MQSGDLSAGVVGIVLTGALLHAIWNAILKSAPDKNGGAMLVVACAAGLSAMLLPFLAQPARASWPNLAASAVCQVVYYRLLAAAYTHGALSQVFPVMRGTAPLLVAAASPLIGEHLKAGQWAGVLLVCSGVLGLSLTARAAGQGRGAALALLNAGVIAGYTLIDGVGVRLSGAPAGYALWAMLLPALALIPWTLLRDSTALRSALGERLPFGLIGGAATLSSYGLALWAMTMAPVALVATLRETSILFATCIAAFVLKERVTGLRVAMTLVIAARAALLRLA